jgi:beta-RFAP synthase
MEFDPSTTTTTQDSAWAGAGQAQRTVWVEAPARLHLGFLDPAGSLGRPFGSLGLTVSAPVTRLGITAASGAVNQVSAGAPQVPAEDLQRAERHLAELQRRSGRPQPLALQLDCTLAPHAGLGSGTQLALAVGRAFACWHGLEVPTATLAAWLGRGLRSGVGIAGFDQGGLLLDGGPLPADPLHPQDTRPAPLLARLPLPPAWRVLLVGDPLCRGLSGSAERSALAALAPLPQSAAAAICHETLMRVLPGAAGAGFAATAEGLTRIQTILGEHFGPAQGGDVFVSPAVGRLLRWIGEQARRPAAGLATSDLGAGIGQSSWGPTGFALLPSAQRAQQLLDAARAAGVVDPALTLRIAEPLNRGARVIEHPPRRADAAAAQESSARHGSDEAEVDHWPPPQRSHAPARSPQLGR